MQGLYVLHTSVMTGLLPSIRHPEVEVMVHTRASARLKSDLPSQQHGSTISPPASLLATESSQLTESSPASSTAGQDMSNQQPLTQNGIISSARYSVRSARTKADFTAAAADHIMTPATAEDRRNWHGWCEIESEPVSLLHVIRNSFPPLFTDSCILAITTTHCFISRPSSMSYFATLVSKISRYKKLSVLTKKCWRLSRELWFHVTPFVSDCLQQTCIWVDFSLSIPGG